MPPIPRRRGQPEGAGSPDREAVALFCLVLGLASPEGSLVLSVNESLMLNGIPRGGRGPAQRSPYILATGSAGHRVTQA